MLKWHKNLYLGSCAGDVGKIRRSIEKGRPVPGIYLLTLPTNPSNLLDILPALTLVQKTAAAFCPEIIGMAKGRREAFALVQEIVETVYKETGDFRIAEYLENR